MSRMTTGDMIRVKPTNNVYTVLVIAGTLAVVLAIVVIYLRGVTLFGDGWYKP